MSRIDYRPLAPRLPDGPLSLDELLPGTGPVEVEIGFGRGAFILGRAVAVPEHRLLGLEVKNKLAYQVEVRRIRARAENVRLYAADAKDVLPRLVKDASVRRVYVHFPDPWWKARHEKRNVLSPEVIRETARLLEPKGEFFIQTDVEDRAVQYLDRIRQTELFDLSTDSGWAEPQDYGAQSNREQRALIDGLPIYRILAKRRVSV